MKEAVRRAIVGTGATALVFVAAAVWFAALHEATGAPLVSFTIAMSIALLVGVLAARRQGD
jgi:hypothetical protein